MRIARLELKDFKNYERADLSPCEGVNILVGDNAQGKTNLLEALYYLCALRSFRPLKDKELIRFEKERADITASIVSGRDQYTLEAGISLEGRRDIRINGVRIRRTADMLGSLNCVLFSPEDLTLVKGGSAVRRRFLNLSLCQLRPRYFELISEYNRLIVRKSRMLKDYYAKPSLYEAIKAYNQRIAQTGGAVVSYRAWFINKLDNYARIIHRDIAPGESLRLEYTAGGENPGEIDEQSAVDRLAEKLETGLEKELGAKTCLYGPHRDDITITLDDMPARLYASQGQARTAALAIKLAERDVFFEDTGERPVLLLDDLLSELDRGRQEYILASLGEGQVFITCCDLNPRAGELAGRVFRVEDGIVGPGA